MDATREHGESAESRIDSSASGTLRIRQVERSLAQKKLEEEIESSKKADVGSCAPSVGNGSAGDGEARRGTVWEDAQGCPSAECHGWSWRDRYMDLRGQVEKWKTELSADEEALVKVQASRRDKGVGEGVAQQGAPDDMGIEGLTIVVHMRHRDDLVINTKVGGEARVEHESTARETAAPRDRLEVGEVGLTARGA